MLRLSARRTRGTVVGKIIVTEVDYTATMARVDALMGIDPDENTPEALELETLVEAIMDYERRQGWL